MISPARSAALKALETYRKKGELTAPRCHRPDDSRLAECIVQGVIQNERFLDDCLSGFLRGGLSRTHPRILDVLRLSAFQILFLDRIPDSAAVNDGVQLCREGKLSYASGMVNAVLRKVSDRKYVLLQNDRDLAIRYSCPDWFVDSLLKEHDRDFVRAFLESCQVVPDLRLQVNTLRCSLEQYRELLRSAGVSELGVNERFSSVLVPACEVESLPGYAEGLFYVQDDAARAVVKIAGLKSGMSVLDACAAPGGKSISAALDGGVVLSADLSEKRLLRCEENYRRMRLNIPVRQMDASAFDSSLNERFDVVIADVPCSGSGVIRKHPEIRRRSLEELDRLKEMQRAILENLSHYVRPGGMLIYSTCSVLTEEDEPQVLAFLDSHSEFRLSSVTMEGFRCENGMLRSWPQENGNDGFFAAKLIRQDTL